MMRFYIYFKRFLLSIGRYLFMDLLSFAEITTQILLFICIINWYNLYQTCKSLNFNIDKDILSTDLSLFSSFEEIAIKFEYYQELQGFTIFSLTIQIVRYVYFSRKMSRLQDVFRTGKLDLIFFIAIFSIILTAFSLMAYFNFGVMLSGFNTIQNSVGSCVILIMGNVYLQDLQKASAILGPLFYFSFMVFMSLILSNMFIAILDGHYYDNNKEEFELNSINQERYSFFGWLNIILKEECVKINDERKNVIILITMLNLKNFISGKNQTLKIRGKS